MATKFIYDPWQQLAIKEQEIQSLEWKKKAVVSDIEALEKKLKKKNAELRAIESSLEIEKSIGARIWHDTQPHISCFCMGCAIESEGGAPCRERVRKQEYMSNRESA